MLDTILRVTEKTTMNVLNACPGNIHVVYQIRPSKHQITENQTICILFPWTLPTLADIHYLELDTPFDDMNSYVYCVMQGAMLNELIPNRITIAPSEC